MVTSGPVYPTRSIAAPTPRRILFGAWFYTEASFAAWIVLGPLALFIAADMHFSQRALYALIALPILVGTICHLPVGLLADRFGARRVGLIVHALVILALLMFILTSEHSAPAFLFVGAALLGLAGVAFAISMPLVSRVFPEEQQGRALGLTAFGGVGALFSAFVAPVLAQAHGWRTAVLLVAGQMFLSLAIFASTAHENGRGITRPTWQGYLQVLRYVDTFWFCLFYVVTFGGMVSLISLLTAFFHDRFHTSPATAGLLTTACVLMGALFRPLGGWLADRHGGIRTLQGAFGVAAVCASWLASITTSPASLSSAVFNALLVTAAFGVGNGAIFQLLPVRFRRHMGVITGVVGAAGGAGGFLFLFLHGWLQKSWATVHPLFLFYAAFCLLGLIGLASVKRRWRTTWGTPRSTTARV
ncbi:MAG: NarK/NasA family nitrate transporter [Magnetococcales bacterium]|nr:NarK/NasA family nitrate transporter [Magnetococcales bacterium]